MKYTGWDSLDVLFQSVFGLVKGNCSIKFINQSWKGLETNLIHIWNQHQKHVSSRFPPPWDLCFQTSLYRQLLFVDAKAWNPQLPVCGSRCLFVCDDADEPCWSQAQRRVPPPHVLRLVIEVGGGWRGWRWGLLSMALPGNRQGRRWRGGAFITNELVSFSFHTPTN